MKTIATDPTEIRSPWRRISRAKRSRNVWRDVTAVAVTDWSLHATRSTTAMRLTASAFRTFRNPSGATTGSSAGGCPGPRSIRTKADPSVFMRNARGASRPRAHTW